MTGPIPSLRQVQVEGNVVAYRRVGSGPPVVLVHGGWSDSRQWRVQFEGLADTFELVAWDAPGSGGSWDPPATFRMADFADALAALISAIGLHRPAVIGLSFGAAVTIELERRHPGLAHSLVLVGAYAGWAGSLPHEVVVARRRAALAEAALPRDEWVVVARRYLPGFFATDVSPELADETLALMADARPAGTRAFVEAMAEADLRAGLEQIRSPVLLVYGELDQRSPLAVATDLAARIPTSGLTVIPGVGHLCNLEAPEACNEAVRVFLSGDAMPSP